MISLRQTALLLLLCPLATHTAEARRLTGRDASDSPARKQKNRTVVAFERIATGMRPLYKHPSTMAFRQPLGAREPAHVASEAQTAKYGISIYRAPEGQSARAAFTAQMVEDGYEELPCLTPGTDQWIVPTDLLIVQFARSAAPADIQTFLRATGATIVRERVHHKNQYVVRVPDARASLEIAYAWNSDPLVIWAQANCFRQAEPRMTPNDTLFYAQWHLLNTNQNGSLIHRDVSATRAWNISTGSTNVVIAVLDDGFDTNHVDLAANCLTNGWDFVDDDSDVSPAGGANHGMFVAGVCSAVTSNGIGVAGLAVQCKLLPIRVYEDGVVDIDWADSIEYAADRADVLNISYLVDPAPVNVAAIRYAVTSGRGGRGCVIAGAHGNVGVFRRYINDAVTSAEILSVSGTSNYDRRSYFGDYGPSLRLVGCAGGGNIAIITLDRSNRYNTVNAQGTSFSCPLATGIAALLISENPQWSGLEVRRQIESTCDKVDAGAYPYNARGWNSTYGFGRLNAWEALTADPAPWDPYEPDNTSVNAAPIEDGELQYRSLQTGADEDWVRLTVTNTFDLQLTVVGTTNAGLELYDSSVALIATNTSGWPSYCYLLSNSLPGSTYYARVYSPPGVAISNYGLHMAVLNLLDVHEPDNVRTNARTIEPWRMHYHTLYPSSDVDYVTFTLDTNATARFWTMGELGGDTLLWLHNSNGTEIGSADDGVPNSYYSYMETNLTPAQYYLRVQDFSNAPLASYQILYELYAHDTYEPNNTYTQATPIASGQRMHGSLFPTNDLDWFVFSISNRANVLVLTDTINPYWYADSELTLYNSNVVEIAYNNNGNNLGLAGWGYSAIFKTNLAAGTYYIKAANYWEDGLPAFSDPDYYVALDVFSAEAEMTEIGRSTAGVDIEWSGDAAFSYRVERGSDTNWSAVTNLDGRVYRNYWSDPDATNSTWYRVMGE